MMEALEYSHAHQRHSPVLATHSSPSWFEVFLLPITMFMLFRSSRCFHRIQLPNSIAVLECPALLLSTSGMAVCRES